MIRGKRQFSFGYLFILFSAVALLFVGMSLFNPSNAYAGCGNGVIQGDEECDDGNRTDGDGCSSNCKIESYCGDGNLDRGEECDDGNNIDGDGCSVVCTIEPFCGDGNLDRGEECDDGNNQDDDGCSAVCTIEPFCGDGVLDDGEGCDDGNNIDGDGCSAECTNESFCGDGVLDDGEGCDDGNNIDGDGCSSNCTIEPYCGDGNLDPGEGCDDGNNIDGDGCSAICTIEGGEGCTPGYWKQQHHFDSWVRVSPDGLFGDIFDDAFPRMTLRQVLKQGGGGIKALGRHTVAALLNAISPEVMYNLSATQVIGRFNRAYRSGDDEIIEAVKDSFNFFNEQGCPLN